jgi:uncharacterized protein
MTRLPARVFVDTNIRVSAFIHARGHPAAVLAAFLDGRFVPVVSQPFLDELQSVLQRGRIRRRLQFTDEATQAVLDQLQAVAIFTMPDGVLRICRDPRDDILLETAILGKADYIVSRDDDMKRDLAVIAYLRERGIEVLSVSQFLELMAVTHS